MSEEFYPMPSFPTLMVRNLAASTHWYQETLGFQLVFEIRSESGKPVLTHLRWTKYADLLLVAENPPQLLSEPKGIGVTLTFAVFEGSVDELTEQARVRGVNIVAGPVEQPWNAREVTMLAPDGYRLTFTQRVNHQMRIDQVVANVIQSTD